MNDPSISTTYNCVKRRLNYKHPRIQRNNDPERMYLHVVKLTMTTHRDLLNWRKRGHLNFQRAIIRLPRVVFSELHYLSTDQPFLTRYSILWWFSRRRCCCCCCWCCWYCCCSCCCCCCCCCSSLMLTFNIWQILFCLSMFSILQCFCTSCTKTLVFILSCVFKSKSCLIKLLFLHIKV